VDYGEAMQKPSPNHANRPAFRFSRLSSPAGKPIENRVPRLSTRDIGQTQQSAGRMWHAAELGSSRVTNMRVVGRSQFFSTKAQGRSIRWTIFQAVKPAPPSPSWA